MKYHFLFIALIISSILPSCGYSKEEKDIIEKAERCATELSSKSFKNEMELQKAIFDVVAVRSNIEKNSTPENVELFRKTFESKLTELNDSLAKIIFDTNV